MFKRGVLYPPYLDLTFAPNRLDLGRILDTSLAKFDIGPFDPNRFDLGWILIRTGIRHLTKKSKTDKSHFEISSIPKKGC